MNWERVFSELSAFGYAAVLTRIVAAGLFRRYRFFALFVCASLLASVALLRVEQGTDSYALTYIACEATVLFLSFLVVFELYRLILNNYPSLAAAGEWLMKAVIPVAVLLCLASAIPALMTPTHSLHNLDFLFVTQRTVVLIISSFLLVIVVLLIIYPIVINRNLVLYCCGFGALFIIGVAAPVLAEWANSGASSGATSSINIACDAIESTVLFSWTLLLSRRGEQSGVPLRSLTQEEGTRLLAQLNGLDTTASQFLSKVRNRKHFTAGPRQNSEP